MSRYTISQLLCPVTGSYLVTVYVAIICTVILEILIYKYFNF